MNIEFGGEEDHIHLLLDMHPNIMPSRFINSLKTVSSRLIRKEFSIYLHPNALALWVENSAYIKEWLNLDAFTVLPRISYYT